MAVFTKVTEAQAVSLLGRYSIGELQLLTPVGQGIENSNYFITTKVDDGAQQRWVLTLFETLSQAELPFFFNVTQAVQLAGLPVPAPVASAST